MICLSLKGKKVYHGSHKKVDKKLLPKKAVIYFGTHAKLDKVAKVYASENKNFAEIFMIDAPKAAFVFRDKIYLRINKKDINKLKKGGYLYTLDRADFKKNYKIISNNELVSEKPVKILKREYIPNVYNHIIKNKKIELKLVEDTQRPFKR